MCTECVIAPWPHTRTKELPFFLAGFGTDHFHWQDSGRHQIVPSGQGSIIVARVFSLKNCFLPRTDKLCPAITVVSINHQVVYIFF